jgi:transcriptional/translational regulatory protein YebC/TACO1
MDAILTKAIDQNINVDFENDNDDVNITTDPDTLDTLTDIMNELDISGNSMLGYIPQSKIDMNDDDKDKNLSLIDDIEELEDVDQIYHNMNI